MRPPRFRLRTLMLLVAIAALAMAVRMMSVQRQEHLWQRDRFARLEFYSRTMAHAELASQRLRSSMTQRLNPRQTIEFSGLPDNSTSEEARDRQRLKQARGLVEYYEAMKKKYEYAASHPWLIVPPDPPEPASPY